MPLWVNDVDVFTVGNQEDFGVIFKAGDFKFGKNKPPRLENFFQRTAVFNAGLAGSYSIYKN